MAQRVDTKVGITARFYAFLYRLIAAIVASAILIITVGISIDVIIRNAGLGVLPWMLEATEYCLFVATFLGAPWVLHLGEHVRIDMLVNNLPRLLRNAAEVIADAAGLLVSGVLFYFGARVAYGSWADDALVIKELVFPEWWIFAVVTVSAFLLCVEFIRRLRNVRGGNGYAPPSESAHGGL